MTIDQATDPYKNIPCPVCGDVNCTLKSLARDVMEVKRQLLELVEIDDSGRCLWYPANRVEHLPKQPKSEPSNPLADVTESIDRIQREAKPEKDTPLPRKLTSHQVDGLNEQLTIHALDNPGSGGASHHYRIVATNPRNLSIKSQIEISTQITFQHGPIAEVGHNGISNEALLAIVEDRLLGFQSSDYACRENAVALTHIQTAMMFLQKRTRDRMARGVEGTSQK